MLNRIVRSGIVLIMMQVKTRFQISAGANPSLLRAVREALRESTSGGRLCTLIGVPWRGVSFSTLSTGRFVLKQYICKGAQSAEHAETAGYTYEGTPTTA